MKIIDKPLLASMRKSGECEICGRYCRLLCGAHVLSRSAGRMDIPLNLVSCGFNPWDCRCHHDSHNEPSKGGIMLLAVAKRVRVAPDGVLSVLHMLRRLPKRPRADEVSAELESILDEARPLAVKTLKELGIYE